MKRLAFALIMFLLIAPGCGSRTTAGEGPAEGPPPAQETKEPAAPGPEPPEEPPGETIPEECELPGALLAVIDNHPSARPQAGLENADIVYEAVTEFGITRFLAVYCSRAAERVGPIRSARYYFAQIARAYNSPFAHAGGNNDALALIPRLGIKDMDEIYNAGAWFFRDRSGKPPHNLYTSTELLWRGAEHKGYSPVRLSPLPEGEPEGGESATWLQIRYADYKSYKYTTGYKYGRGIYTKYADGEPFLSASGRQLTASNVIVIFAPTRTVMKEDWESEIDLIGEGEALYFTRGKVHPGRWAKPSPEDHFSFLTPDGKPMLFSRGITWIQIVPEKNVLSYGP